MSQKKIVLITGCSDGGLGSSLALAFHATGKYRVIATARNLNKLSATRAKGIEELPLDVLSAESISTCVQKLEALTGGHLDMLVNNAGGGYNIPVLDMDLVRAKEVFDLNVWSPITVSRAFLPLLMKSKEAKIVNNVSIVAYVGIPFQGVYNASKAAANSFTENLRLELKPFGIKVVALITGGVKSNFYDSANFTKDRPSLPSDSIFNVVPNGLSFMADNAGDIVAHGMKGDEWARGVVSDLSASNPSYQIWRGRDAWKVRYGTLLPLGTFDNTLMSIAKMEEVENALKTAK